MIRLSQFSVLKALIITLFGLVLVMGGTRAAAQHTINHSDVDIRAFIEDTSVLTGKTFIIDPRVSGTVSVFSQAKLSKSEVFQVFQDVLRVRGFTAIPTSNGAYRITLIQGAAQDAPLAKNTGYPGALSTVVLKMTHGSASNAAQLIKPILHSQGRLTSVPNGKVLVVTDYPENLKKARAIIEAMDVNTAAIETIPLQHISAADAKDAVTALMGTGAPQVRNNIVVGETVKAVAMEATNSLVLRGDPADIAQLKEMIVAMDQAGSIPRGQISVIPLRHADGEELVTILEKLLPAFNQEVATGPAPSVAYEPGSNTLIISADPSIQQSLESVVRRLDVRRAQVLVEAIIVEISDTAAKDLGVQFLLAGNEDSSLPFVSTNYSRAAPNLLTLAGAIATDNANGNEGLGEAALQTLLGAQGGTIGTVGIGNDGLFGAVLNAVQSDTDSNVLSTPFVTTMDNVPAIFLVGQEVPFSSGETLGNNNSNPFRTITREEVGIRLEVLPQITEGDVVRLEIVQEVSSIAPAASAIATDLVTNKREITTTVLADDGEMIVLGGLIEDDEELIDTKVPVLGDIPIVGNLFKSTSDTRTRTNLMVFIRPTILRSAQDAAPVTQQKLDLVRMEEYRRNGEGPLAIDNALENTLYNGTNTVPPAPVYVPDNQPRTYE
ncbi:MAG: type II secretion system protein GspD [Acidimicrobiales bacterium]|nr:type II secretion system secretin GspD [Hyphomonadaceae bacterium]RZV39459.1 MAG: type II secretion system protein GspD [Acidimicrobiales bacterium]